MLVLEMEGDFRVGCEELRVMRASCPECGKTFFSLYQKQLDSMVREHQRRHKIERGEE